jgi:hypothetical protein
MDTSASAMSTPCAAPRGQPRQLPRQLSPPSRTHPSAARPPALAPARQSLRAIHCPAPSLALRTCTASMSSGEGRYLMTESSSGCTPLFLKAVPHTMGTKACAGGRARDGASRAGRGASGGGGGCHTRHGWLRRGREEARTPNPAGCCCMSECGQGAPPPYAPISQRPHAPRTCAMVPLRMRRSMVASSGISPCGQRHVHILPQPPAVRAASPAPAPRARTGSPPDARTPPCVVLPLASAPACAPLAAHAPPRSTSPARRRPARPPCRSASRGTPWPARRGARTPVSQPRHRAMTARLVRQPPRPSPAAPATNHAHHSSASRQQARQTWRPPCPFCWPSRTGRPHAVQPGQPAGQRSLGRAVVANSRCWPPRVPLR